MNNNRLNTLLEMYNPEEHDSFVLFAIAKEYSYINEPDKAIATFEDLKAKDEKYVGLYYHLAQLYADNDEVEKAMKTYDEGIQVAKKQADFHALSELMNAKTNLEME